MKSLYNGFVSCNLAELIYYFSFIGGFLKIFCTQYQEVCE